MPETIKINRKELSNRTDTPTLDYCRQLLKEGHDPSTRLEIYRDRPEWDYAILSIGEGAKWTVDGNRVREHRPKHLKGGSKAGTAPLVSFNE